MREICMSGSEGGAAQTNALSLPLSANVSPKVSTCIILSGGEHDPVGLQRVTNIFLQRSREAIRVRPREHLPR